MPVFGADVAHVFYNGTYYDKAGVLQTIRGERQVDPTYLQAWAGWFYWWLRGQGCDAFIVLGTRNWSEVVRYTYP